MKYLFMVVHRCARSAEKTITNFDPRSSRAVERERDRAELLVSEVLAATADMMEAKQTAAKLEGELVALRSLLPKPMSWWRWLRTSA